MKSSMIVAIAAAVTLCSLGEPALAQGRGIGRYVSQMARNGVHGQQLANQVHQLQARQGIGQVNAGGGRGGHGMMGFGQGGPGMIGGGKGGPGMMGGGKGGHGMIGGGKGKH